MQAALNPLQRWNSNESVDVQRTDNPDIKKAQNIIDDWPSKSTQDPDKDLGMLWKVVNIFAINGLADLMLSSLRHLVALIRMGGFQTTLIAVQQSTLFHALVAMARIEIEPKNALNHYAEAFVFFGNSVADINLNTNIKYWPRRTRPVSLPFSPKKDSNQSDIDSCLRILTDEAMDRLSEPLQQHLCSAFIVMYGDQSIFGRLTDYFCRIGQLFNGLTCLQEIINPDEAQKLKIAILQMNLGKPVKLEGSGCEFDLVRALSEKEIRAYQIWLSVCRKAGYFASALKSWQVDIYPEEKDTLYLLSDPFWFKLADLN